MPPSKKHTETAAYPPLFWITFPEVRTTVRNKTHLQPRCRTYGGEDLCYSDVICEEHASRREYSGTGCGIDLCKVVPVSTKSRR